MAASKFALTLLLDQGKNNSHFRMVRVLAPTLVVVHKDGCSLASTLISFFQENPDVHVEAKAPSESVLAAHTQLPQVEVTITDATYSVPLPEMHDGAAASTLRNRLQRHFCRKPVNLRDHQKDLIKALADRDFMQRNTPAFTMYWEMGSGKTLETLTLLLNHRSTDNVIVCNNTNIEYWSAALHTAEPNVPLGPDERNIALKFDIVGYTAFRTDYDDQRAMRRVTCVVLDEAHYFRNNTSGMQYAMECVRSARNVILLTGTPIVNDVEDVDGMLELIDMDGVLGTAGRRPTPKELQSMLTGHVSWFDPSVHRPNMFKRHYPEVIEQVVEVEMLPTQVLEYMMARHSVYSLGHITVHQGRTNRYNAFTRAICNAPTTNPEQSPKLRAVLGNLLERMSLGPQVVHSSLVETGVKPLMIMLKDVCPAAKVDIITGETDNTARDRTRRLYNSGKLDVLFISDASQQGTDLMGTATIHLIEAFPNKSLHNQTRARVVRMGSHRKSKHKSVVCYSYVSTFPSNLTAANASEIEKYIIAHKLLGRETAKLVKEIDIRKEIMRQITMEENNRTINQKQMVNNEEKQRLIDPYLDAFRRATVSMSTQKGTTLFENTTADAKVEHARAAGAKAKKPRARPPPKTSNLDELPRKRRAASAAAKPTTQSSKLKQTTPGSRAKPTKKPKSKAVPIKAQLQHDPGTRRYTYKVEANLNPI